MAASWTPIFESLHSVMLDLLVDKHPAPKPELGMPVRTSRFELPNGPLEIAWLLELSQDGQKGWGVLALDAGVSASCKMKPEAWGKLLETSLGSEFVKRGIKPRVEGLKSFLGPLPKEEVPKVARLVLAPMRVSGGTAYVGLGV